MLLHIWSRKPPRSTQTGPTEPPGPVLRHHVPVARGQWPALAAGGCSLAAAAAATPGESSNGRPRPGRGAPPVRPLRPILTTVTGRRRAERLAGPAAPIPATRTRSRRDPGPASRTLAVMGARSRRQDLEGPMEGIEPGGSSHVMATTTRRGNRDPPTSAFSARGPLPSLALPEQVRCPVKKPAHTIQCPSIRLDQTVWWQSGAALVPVCVPGSCVVGLRVPD